MPLNLYITCLEWSNFIEMLMIVFNTICFLGKLQGRATKSNQVFGSG